MKYLILEDLPTPWRDPVYEKVHGFFGDQICVSYCKSNEERRLWKFRLGNHRKVFLRAFRFFFAGKERHLNPGIIPFLLKNRPKIIVHFGIKDPTVIIALVTSRLIGSKLAVLSDSWAGREMNISFLQKAARWIMYNLFSDVYIGASKQTLALFRKYNPRIQNDQQFLSALCADNDYFSSSLKDNERNYDVLFAGRIAKEKNPVFFAKVCAGIREKRGECRVLIIGEGDEEYKNEMSQILSEANVDYNFAGFIFHDQLPNYYSQAKLLLLPTSGDCWGVVINEAMASGTPVATTNLTAAAGELVLHGETGLVIDFDVKEWTSEICSLLDDSVRLEQMSKDAKAKVADFSFERAAEGIIDAISYAEGRELEKGY